MRTVTTTILSVFKKFTPNYIIDGFLFCRGLAGNDLEGTLDFIADIPSTIYQL
jgi:hypothetical protein